MLWTAAQAMFHAVFTWLTFRMFGVLLVYVSTLASAVGAVMPLVPVWLIAVPAAAQLALQVRPAVKREQFGDELLCDVGMRLLGLPASCEICMGTDTCCSVACQFPQRLKCLSNFTMP